MPVSRGSGFEWSDNRGGAGGWQRVPGSEVRGPGGGMERKPWDEREMLPRGRVPYAEERPLQERNEAERARLRAIKEKRMAARAARPTKPPMTGGFAGGFGNFQPSMPPEVSNGQSGMFGRMGPGRADIYTPENGGGIAGFPPGGIGVQPAGPAPTDEMTNRRARLFGGGANSLWNPWETYGMEEPDWIRDSGIMY